MARGDGTGPMGLGPMTGRGAGYCNGFAAPGFTDQAGFAGGRGRVLERGRGNGNMFRTTGMRGWGRCGYPVFAGQSKISFNEKTFLTDQAEFLENQLQRVKKQLSDLNEETE